MTDHQAAKALYLMDRNEMAYSYLTNPLSQCWLQASYCSMPEFNIGEYNIDNVLEAVM